MALVFRLPNQRDNSLDKCQMCQVLPFVYLNGEKNENFDLIN